MIHHLNGRLVEKHPTHVIVECGGVGYFVRISLNTFSALGDNENIKILIRPVYREDDQILFGFADAGERDTFDRLISVSGVGATTALVVLSSLTPADVAEAVALGDVSAFKSVKGIGAKTAQRIIVDLQDKMKGVDLSAESQGGGNTSRTEALSALLALGFDGSKAEKAVNAVYDADKTVEQLIKEALKNI